MELILSIFTFVIKAVLYVALARLAWYVGNYFKNKSKH